MPVQNTFTLISEARAAPSNVPNRPMTSKQIKKAHREANRQPKLSRAEQRKLELAEQERIRKELEQERAAARARAARERKKAKEEEKKEAKRRSGKPLVDVRPSQDLIVRFMRGNGTGKKRDGRGVEVGSLRSVTEEAEPRETDQQSNEPTLDDSEMNKREDGPKGSPETPFQSVTASRSSQGGKRLLSHNTSGDPTLPRDPPQHEEGNSPQDCCSVESHIRPASSKNPSEANVPKSAPLADVENESEAANVIPESNLEEDADMMDLLLDLSPGLVEGGSEDKARRSPRVSQHREYGQDETAARPSQPKAPDKGDFLDPLLEDEALEALVESFDDIPSSTPKPRSIDLKDVEARSPASSHALPPPAPNDNNGQPKDEFSSFSIDDWDDGMLQQLDGTQPEPERGPLQEPITERQHQSAVGFQGDGDKSAFHVSFYDPSCHVESPSPPQQRQQPPMSTQAVLLNFDEFFPSPSQQETELECHAPPEPSSHTPCPPPRSARDLTTAVPHKETPKTDQSLPSKRFFSASGSNELLSLAIHRSRRTAALEDIHEQERQRVEAGLLQAKQRPATEGRRCSSRLSMAPPLRTASAKDSTKKLPISSEQTSYPPAKLSADMSDRHAESSGSSHSQKRSALAPKGQTIKTTESQHHQDTSSFAKPHGKQRSPGKENNPFEDLDSLLMASQETDFGGDWIDQAAHDLTIDACT